MCGLELWVLALCMGDSILALGYLWLPSTRESEKKSVEHETEAVFIQGPLERTASPSCDPLVCAYELVAGKKSTHSMEKSLVVQKHHKNRGNRSQMRKKAGKFMP